MSILDQVADKGNEWSVMGNKTPDTVLIPVDIYHKMVDELNRMTPFCMSKDGRYKFMGMDVVPSRYVDDIKVGRMNP